jgi:hypothetical protein
MKYLYLNYMYLSNSKRIYRQFSRVYEVIQTLGGCGWEILVPGFRTERALRISLEGYTKQQSIALI